MWIFYYPQQALLQKKIHKIHKNSLKCEVAISVPVHKLLTFLSDMISTKMVKL